MPHCRDESSINSTATTGTTTTTTTTTTTIAIADVAVAGADAVVGATDIATIKRAQNYFPPLVN